MHPAAKRGDLVDLMLQFKAAAQHQIKFAIARQRRDPIRALWLQVVRVVKSHHSPPTDVSDKRFLHGRKTHAITLDTKRPQQRIGNAAGPAFTIGNFQSEGVMSKCRQKALQCLGFPDTRCAGNHRDARLLPMPQHFKAVQDVLRRLGMREVARSPWAEIGIGNPQMLCHVRLL